MLRLLICMWMLLCVSIGGMILLMGGFLSERKDGASSLQLGKIPGSYARRPKWESETGPLPQLERTLPTENELAALPDPESQTAPDDPNVEADADAMAVAVPTEANAPKQDRPRSMKRRATAADAKVAVHEKKWKQRPGRKRFGRFSGRRFFR